MDTVKIIAPGTMCKLVKGDSAEAMVIAVTIREHGPASYEIVWWLNGSRQTAWVEPCEIEPGSEGVREIGFKG